MPVYEIEAPDGRIIEMEGPRPPNDFQIKEAFSAIGAASKPRGQAPLPVVTAQPMPQTMAQFGKERVTDPLLRTAGAVGEFVDRYTGAPSRAAFEASLARKKEAGLPVMLSAFARQFGKDPAQAPTGKQIAARQFGLSTDPMNLGFMKASPAGIAGLGIDIGVDVGNLPLGPIAKTGLKALKPITAGALKGSGAVFDVATGTDIARKTGAAASAFGETVGRRVKGTFSGAKAADLPKWEGIAKKNNIDITPIKEYVEYDKSSPIKRQAMTKAEGPEGQALLKGHENVNKQIDKALVKHVEKVSGNQVINQADAGGKIREGYFKGVNKAFRELDMTYNSILKGVPDLQIPDEALQKMQSRLGIVRNMAEETMEIGASDEIRNAAKQIVRNLDFIDKADGSYAQTLRQLRQIGKAAFGNNRKFVTPPDQESMRDLYGILRDALTETADDLDPIIGQQLRRNNEIASQLIGEKSIVAKVMADRNIGDEKLFRRLVQNGDTKQLAVLKKLLPEKDWKAAKGAYMNTIMKENIAGEQAAGTLFSKLRKIGKTGTFDVLFEKGEMDNFIDLLELKDHIGPAKMSSSGTGATNMFISAMKETVPKATDAAIAAAIEAKRVKRPSKIRPIIKKVPKTGLKAAQVYSVQRRD